MAAFRQGTNEIRCEVCEAIAAKDTSQVGEPVINRGDICVNLTGEQGDASRLSALRPELACLPKMRLCHTHLTQQRRQGGEWVTITEAAAMMARRDKKEMESAPAPVQRDDGTGSRLVTRLMENLGGTATVSCSPYLILRKRINK